MGRIGIEYSDVARVANEMSMQGRNPTVELIRRKLGTGSFTTIANHLRQWRSIKTNVDSKTKLPEELLNIVDSLYKAIQEDADEKIEKSKKENDDLIKELKDSLAVEHQKCLDNIRRINELEASIAYERDQKGKISELLKIKQEELQNHLHKYSIVDVQLQDKQEQIQELKDRHHQLQDNLNHYREAVKIQREDEKTMIEQQKSLLEQQIIMQKEQIIDLKHQNQLLKSLTPSKKTVD